MTARVEDVEDTDWSGLFHALGPASDTPRQPAALLGDDARAFTAGYTHLWSATLRQDGRAWPATAPTALLVAGLLDDPLLGRDDPSLPEALLAYLHAVAVVADLGDRAEQIRARVAGRARELRSWTADYLSTDDDGRARMWADATGPGGLVLDRAGLTCFDAVPGILTRVLPHLASGRSRHRACAAAAVGSPARHPSAAARRPALLERLVSTARAADSPYDLAPVVLAIGRLGGDTRPWLGDPHLGVRGCAALAPGLADDDTAARVLAEPARSPRAFAASFGDMAPPLQFQSEPYRRLLTPALLWRAAG